MVQGRRDEFYARTHNNGWIFNESNLQWEPPIPYPNDGFQYMWDNQSINWIKLIDPNIELSFL